jgi:hypothetical protein
MEAHFHSFSLALVPFRLQRGEDDSPFGGKNPDTSKSLDQNTNLKNQSKTKTPVNHPDVPYRDAVPKPYPYPCPYRTIHPL